MSTYRTGNNWGVTIVREPDAPDASDYVCDGCGGQAEVWIDERPLCRREPEVRADAQLVAVVVNGDLALAERICALLNGETLDAIDRILDDYRGAKALREGIREVVSQARAKRELP